MRRGGSIFQLDCNSDSPAFQTNGIECTGPGLAEQPVSKMFHQIRTDPFGACYHIGIFGHGSGDPPDSLRTPGREEVRYGHSGIPLCETVEREGVDRNTASVDGCAQLLRAGSTHIQKRGGNALLYRVLRLVIAVQGLAQVRAVSSIPACLPEQSQ